MHRTTRGLVVTRISVNNGTYEEIKRYAKEHNTTPNKAIKELLNTWALGRLEHRNKGERADAMLTWMKGDPDC